MRLISTLLTVIGTAAVVANATDITTVIVPVTNLRLEYLNGTSGQLYRLTGRVQYDLVAGGQDSLNAQLVFVPAVPTSSAPVIVPDMVSGDAGMVMPYSGRRTIYFACTVDRIPSEPYRARITMAAEQSSLERRADSLLALMQQQEKVDQLHGNGGYETVNNARLGIPGFIMADGPHGVRSGQATLFPTLAAQACTWDTSLSYRIGVALAREFRAKGKYVALGPMINTVRDPRGGRDFETYSEDPFLMSRMAVANVKGIQSLRVVAVPKHLICNDMENNRLYYNVQVSNRTMREIYAPAFKACVQEAGALGIMAAYNKVNGFFCTENKTIITDLLKNEWGFQGFVVSDWGATHSTTNAANGGLDIEMPGGAYFGTPLSAAAAQGGVLQSVIDDKVRRVLKAKIWAGVIDGPIQQYTSYLNCNEHKALALEAGRASIILAKNDANTLPLNASALSSIAVIGPYADAARVGGGGSSEVTPFYSVSPRQGIINKLGAAKVTSDYTKSDVAIVFVGVTGETEGSDRASPGIAVDQNALVNSVINAGKRCIVVFTGGSAAIAGDWSSAQAVVIAFYPGQEQGNAIADVLFGDYNPAGKLPVTFPQSADQLPAFDVNYEIADEGRGYRYFDKHQLNPLYPFGHGLSYTQFTYNTMSITPATVHVGDRITVNVSITNTGSRAGTEIVQLYIGDPSASLPRPVKELKGFSRVTLTPGQSGIASMEIGEDDLSFYNESAGSWVVEPGDIKLLVGASSRDIRLSQTISVQ